MHSALVSFSKELCSIFGVEALPKHTRREQEWYGEVRMMWHQYPVCDGCEANGLVPQHARKSKAQMQEAVLARQRARPTRGREAES